MTDKKAIDIKREYDGDGPRMFFERRDGRIIDSEPKEELFEILHLMSEEELEGLGLQKWSSETGIWLFPVEWFDHIPEGFEITDINGETEEFHEDEKTLEGRFGALPYGVVVDGE